MNLFSFLLILLAATSNCARLNTASKEVQSSVCRKSLVLQQAADASPLFKLLCGFKLPKSHVSTRLSKPLEALSLLFASSLQTSWHGQEHACAIAFCNPLVHQAGMRIPGTRPRPHLRSCNSAALMTIGNEPSEGSEARTTSAEGGLLSGFQELFDELRQGSLTVVLALGIMFSPLFAVQFVNAYAIPSYSMDATLKVGDVVLGETLSSYLHMPIERGDLVFFNAPEELKDIVEKDGRQITSRERFIKRVAAVAGDKVQVDDSGQVLVNTLPREKAPQACPAAPRGVEVRQILSQENDEVPADIQQQLQSLVDSGEIDNKEAAAILRQVWPRDRETATGIANKVFSSSQYRLFHSVPLIKEVPKGTIYVLGDCEARSVDSRRWGPLEETRVTARPFVRIWPPDRVGPIDTTTDRNPFRRSAVRFSQSMRAGPIFSQRIRAGLGPT